MTTAETPIGILAAAYYLPPQRKTVDAIFRDEAIPQDALLTDVDFQKDIGIGAVHVAQDESATNVALQAVIKVIDEAGINSAEIDLIIDFTSIPEEYVAPTWSAAGAIQQAIGAENAWATAVNTGGCASYHTALKTACALMRSHDHLNTALLFAGDKTPPRNHLYYPITVICDGGSAVLLRKHHTKRVILAVEVNTVGKLHDVWYIPGMARRQPDAEDEMSWLYMASDIAKFNREVIPINLFMFRRVMRTVMKQTGLSAEEIDHYIYPTFSSWDQQAFCNGLKIDPEKVYTDGLARHGHLQESDMVLNYVDATDEGVIKAGDIIMVTTNGAGFTWGAALIRQ